MIIGKFILKGELELLSSALIGSGNNENTDIDVILDNNANPYIPGTSLAGVIRNYVKDAPSCDSIFGYTNDTDSEQSTIIFYDLFLNKLKNKTVNPLVRDGIKINASTGIIEDKAKYDYEIVPMGTVFNLAIEFTLKDKLSSECRHLANLITQKLKSETLQIGAKTTNGLGRVYLKTYKLMHYDFQEKADVCYWLLNKDGKEIKVESFTNSTNNNLELEILLELKTSYLSKSYSGDPDLPDVVNYKENKEYILKGSGIKGAVRNRCLKILNTISSDNVKNLNMIDKLFGYVNKDTSSSKKGRFYIQEQILKDFSSETQTRIKIDRFTGGTVDGSKFDAESLFSNKNTNHIKINVQILDCAENEACLMLLVLKEFWTGDLALGGDKNIGRGTMKGVHANIKYQDKEIEFTVSSSLNNNQNDRDFLENLVKKINN